MTDYSKVVDALRCCSKHERRCLECEFLHNGYCSLQLDAAAAIEELDAEETRLLLITSELQDKVVELEELLNDAEIAADDNGRQVEALQAEMRESMQKCAECGAEPITLEQAIDRLHELGWLQEHDKILSQPHWVSVKQPPKEEGRYWCAKKFAGHWIFFAAWYWNNVSDYIGVPVGEEEKAGFVFDEDVVYPDYWMPIEPPQED